MGMEITMSDLKELLEKKGIQPSYQRLKILEYLMQNDVHPTAEVLYRHLLEQIPVLSKTTVYNLLRKLQQAGVVRELRLGEVEIRYDMIMHPHCHFRCRKCKNLYNVEKEISLFKDKEIDGHTIETISVYLEGICKICLGGKEKKVDIAAKEKENDQQQDGIFADGGENGDEPKG